MADNSEQLHSKRIAEKIKGEKARDEAKILEKMQIDSGAKFQKGPLRSWILKKK